MSRLGDIIDIVTANSEESVDDFLELLKPDSHDRDEMGVIYEQTLGYDPTSYYDKQDLSNIADTIAEDPDTPSAVVDAISESKEDIVNAAYDIFVDGKATAFLPAALEEAIEELTGVAVDIDVDDDEDMDSDEDEDDDGFDVDEDDFDDNEDDD